MQRDDSVSVSQLDVQVTPKPDDSKKDQKQSFFSSAAKTILGLTKAPSTRYRRIKENSSVLAAAAEDKLKLAADAKQAPISAQQQSRPIEVGEGNLDLSTLGRKQKADRQKPSSGERNKQQNSESKPLLAKKKPFDCFTELQIIVDKTKQYMHNTNFKGDRFELHNCVANEFRTFMIGRDTALTSDEHDKILKAAIKNYLAQASNSTPELYRTRFEM